MSTRSQVFAFHSRQKMERPELFWVCKKKGLVSGSVSRVGLHSSAGPEAQCQEVGSCVARQTRHLLMALLIAYGMQPTSLAAPAAGRRSSICGAVTMTGDADRSVLSAITCVSG